MMTSLKLQIDIKCESYTDKYLDPQTEFFKVLKSINGLSYTILPFEDDSKDIETDLVEKGQTRILTPEIKYEATGTPYNRAKDIIEVFKKFLDRIISSEHLIIIDYYMFTDDNENMKYSDFITQIFSKHLKKLQKVTFVTSKKKYKKHTEKAIYDSFLNVKSQLKLETKFSDLFHDRLWLCGKRGLFVGASFNGLGKKYCLIDYVDKNDIMDIKTYLLKEGLIKI
ncbi:MAG: hypothetical protein A2W98_08530 [Bacteroidetes bacterium GWF2_33_38]|nr:MAG: hypothetical protein A2W98_08530 [Bacteroidetes bacterium GWF2_33_38]OFY72812.1 MAG: hypothetical protein A2265_08630 [Bacteroidetes bacterium RIFOXYA12_FULL_33_9]OFY86479.1 MAG: hypothetical protein A2236_01325 [Bacteroidetes bacterium RIFOXYA2_FULL_33_7]